MTVDSGAPGSTGPSGTTARMVPRCGKALPGDRERAAQALIKLAEWSTLPARLLLGSDAVKIVTGELDTQRHDVDAWKDVSASTDFPIGA